MPAKKKLTIYSFTLLINLLPGLALFAQDCHSPPQPVLPSSLTSIAIARQLGWVCDPSYFCGGYYLEEPFVYQGKVDNKNAVEITGNEGILSPRGTSFLEGGVTVTRYDQQMTSNKAYVYRDPITAKLKVVDMIGNVQLREPNTLLIAKTGRYSFETKTKSLLNLSYRTVLKEKNPKIKPRLLRAEEISVERRVSNLTAWGKADEFSQTEPGVYELTNSTFTTCPPIDPAWQVSAQKITLNKNTGRGYARAGKIYIKNIPILYFPYINFSIDGQRKSGFLWPTIGRNNSFGPYLLTPFYWNMAPNYDMTITPGLLTKRGLQINDNFRYLLPTSYGRINASILPNDKDFANFQSDALQNKTYINSTDPIVQAELRRLEQSSTTRKGFFWRDDSVFNPHWSSHIDFNYAGDDYYLRDFGSNLNEISQNQLLQQGDLYYKSEHWNFIGRLQAYQTLHPINEEPVVNQYRRLPQLILNGDYPNQAFGLEYFVNNEITHFEFLNTPGVDTDSPVGNRFHFQPGVSLPLSWPYFYMIPRFQVDFTAYNLNGNSTQMPANNRRTVPIFDISSGLALNRNTSLFGYEFRQTLEPQIYYTYIPYRNQSNIPVFDTSVNTLTYDQLFNYNRFSGLDRIGDSNQVALGLATRFIDQVTGLEKVRLGVGEIVYFADRKVTLCNTPEECNDNPTNPSNRWRLSPLFGLVKFNIFPHWSFNANALWNPISKQLGNSTLNLHYQSDANHILNFGFSYAHSGDVLSGLTTENSDDNLKITDISAVWPIMRDVSAVGRWSQNWNRRHLQNLIYGLQYDTCCWAVRLVGGRAFKGLDPNNGKFNYTDVFYIQFALKGLGNIGYGNPSSLLSSISGYTTQFGQDI